jgi:hypothetical protein
MNRRNALGMFGGAAMLACTAVHAAAATALPPVTVHKTESCGCCKLWVEHLQKAGFSVKVLNSENLAPVKQRLGVPAALGSCHTAEVGGYFVEGHVPVQDMQRLLADKPRARGLAVPGMPIGSPGMEVTSGEVAAYEVLLVGTDGGSKVFARHGGRQAAR